MITHDAGMSITTSHGKGFNRVTLPIGQMYHVAVDNQVPYDFYSNMQDYTTMRGPPCRSASAASAVPPSPAGITAWAAANPASRYADPTDPNIVWATCYGDEVTRWDARTKLARSVSPWLHTLDSPPERDQVSLPLDRSAGHRSLRSQHGLLRLPGDFQDHQRRPKLEA